MNEKADGKIAKRRPVSGENTIERVKKLGGENEKMEDYTLEKTGSSFTTTFNIRCFFQINKEKVEVCPIHVKIISGLRTVHYVYQLVPTSHAYLQIEGSENPRGGKTPTQIREDGVFKALHIVADGEGSEIFLRSARDGIIRNTFDEMVNNVPGRFCYEPHAEKVDTIILQSPLVSMTEAIDRIKKYKEVKIGGAFMGGFLKAGWITPTKQGNLFGSAKISAPRWTEITPEEIKRVNSISLKGIEDNEHVIEFSTQVEVIQRERDAIVFSRDEVDFSITHPQHERVEGRMSGLVIFVHRRRRE